MKCIVGRYDNENIKCICCILYGMINANDQGVRLLTPRAENDNKCEEYF